MQRNMNILSCVTHSHSISASVLTIALPGYKSLASDPLSQVAFALSHRT